MAETNSQLSKRAELRGRLLDDLGLRISYVPSNYEERIGELRTSRVAEKVSQLQQVTPFQTWCPPSKKALALPGHSGDVPARTVRSNKNWLLKFQPEACIFDAELKSLLSEEVTSLKRPPALSETTRLLAVGEISDVRQARGIYGRPALATAFGESGHVLRIISLVQEKWAWTDEDMTLCLNSLDSKEEGRWAESQNPITLVKFLVDRDPGNPFRWVAVQNALSTIIFGPEIRILPNQAKDNDPQVRGTFKVTPNLLFSIPAGRTGGSPPSDIAFNPAAYPQEPQLAIIDKNGCWSVWDIKYNRLSRPRAWEPVLRLCGDFNTGIIPKFPPCANMTAVKENGHWVVWVPGPSDKVKAFRDSPSPEQSDVDSDEEPKEMASTTSRFHAILLCNGADLRIFDTKKKTAQPIFNVISPKNPYRVLDVQRSPLHASQLFVLTGTTIFWVTVATQKGVTHLTNILSCPHQMDCTDNRLNMSLALDNASGHTNACFACLRSARDSEMVVVRFIMVGNGASFQYHHGTVRLEGADGHISLSIIPTRRMAKPKQIRGPFERSRPIKDGSSFYQFIALGPDLDLSCSLCVLSDKPKTDISPPDTKVKDHRRRQDRKRQLIQALGQTFMVPDDFDERNILEGLVSPDEDAAFLRPWKNNPYRHADLKLGFVQESKDDSEGMPDDTEILPDRQERSVSPVRRNSSSPPPPAQPRDDLEIPEEPMLLEDDDSYLQWQNDAVTEKIKGWEIGGDSSQLFWMSQDQRRDLEAANRLKKRQEVLRRKKERRIASLRPSQEVGQSAAQPLPPRFLSSQPRLESQGFQSQIWGSSQAMSQIVPGAFGIRPPLPKKPRIKKEPRSGFR